MAAPSQDEIDRMDEEIAQLKEAFFAAQSASKDLQAGTASPIPTLALSPFCAELSRLKSSLSLSELRARYKELSERKAQHESRLAVLREGKNVMSAEDAKAITSAYEKNRKAWRQRRKMVRFDWLATRSLTTAQCTEIMDTILESGSMKKSEFIELVGIETDDAVGVKLDP